MAAKKKEKTAKAIPEVTSPKPTEEAKPVEAKVEKPKKESGTVSRAEFNDLKAFVRKESKRTSGKFKDNSDNWKEFCRTRIGSGAIDGKMKTAGSVKLGLIVLVAVVGLALVLPVMALRPVSGFSSTQMGTARVFTDDAGTATLKIDTISVTNLSFDAVILSNNIQITGSASNVVEIVVTASDSVSLFSLELKSSNASNLVANSDTINLKAVAKNDQNEDIDYGTIQFVLTDVTTNTEDGTIIMKIQVNGVDTTKSTLAAAGLTIVGDVAGTTIGGITQANLTDKTATEAISGDRGFSGTVTYTGLQIITPTALSVTNNQVLTVTEGYYIITPILSTTGFTNTITLANPAVAGTEVIIEVANGATNRLGLADSGNLKLSGAFLGNSYDNIKLRAPTTSIWTEHGSKDN